MKLENKNWGYEKHIVNKKQYCGKILHFVKGHACSFHYHKTKDETFYIKDGSFCVIYSDSDPIYIKNIGDLSLKIPSVFRDHLNLIRYDKSYFENWERQNMEIQINILNQGDHLHIPPERIHTMCALTDTAEIIEFSTQDFKEDSFRIISSEDLNRFI